jgi:hypothetical protein
MKKYKSSELIPGQFLTVEIDGGPHRVDPDDVSNPTMRDRLARLISNAYSGAPGRLCLVKQDYQIADDVIAFFKKHRG